MSVFAHIEKSVWHGVPHHRGYYDIPGIYLLRKASNSCYLGFRDHAEAFLFQILLPDAFEWIVYERSPSGHGRQITTP